MPVVRSRVPIVFLVAGLVVVAAGGCFGRTGGRTDDTLPPPVPTTTTTAVSYAVPAVIDQAYVAKVMAALDHVYGEAVRHLAQTRRIDDQFLKYLVAIHNPRMFGVVEGIWAETQARGFAKLAMGPGDPQTRIDKLVRVDTGCIVIAGDRNFAPLHTEDDPTNHQPFVALTPLRADRNPDRLNPTPWTINFYGSRPDGSLPNDACDAQ
jgi:hypothetical protein